MKKAFALLVLGVTTGLALVPGCGNNEDAYKPLPAFSGSHKATLPPVPTLPSTPIKQGDAYTVYGAVHHLNSSIHSADVTTKEISIVGWIVDSNMATVDKCAIHPTGKKDPDGCVTPIPSFSLGDTKEAKSDPKLPKIRVLGWASNFANVYDALEKYKNLKEPPTEKQVVTDELWAVPVPFPLPAVGAKVKVTGKYGVNFGKSSAGIESDPMNGILTYTTIEVLEPAPEPASFPQIKKP